MLTSKMTNGMVYEVLQITQSIELNDSDDALIWKLEPNYVYTVSSFYATLNFRGVQPLHVHAVWKVKVPPKIQFSVANGTQQNSH
jgi:hypothetical protein